MKERFGKLRRLAYGVVALATLGVAIVPAFSGSVSAAGQVSDRSITMTNATPGASGTSYAVSFEPVTTTTVGGIIVDFCADSPIIGSATCTYPTGFTLGATPTLNATYTGMGTGWTISGSQGGAAGGQTQVARLANVTPQSLTAGAAVTFTLDAVTNPSTTGSFYVRISTFDTSANATSQYTSTGTARTSNATQVNRVDYGGVALSTTQVINISATVMEQLTFCVSKTAPTASCVTPDVPNVTLGAGTPKVLGTATSSDTANHQITTNAASGVVVTLKNTSSTVCGGLSRDNGVTCLIAAKTTAAGAVASSSGQFGLNVGAGSGGTGTVTADTDYAGTNYYMGNATYSGSGDPISSTTGAVTGVNSALTYAAAAAATTPAGVYAATHSLIATGKF